MKEFFKTIYDKFGVKRRFRLVNDGLWIFGYWQHGIFIAKNDFEENKEFYKTYLFDVDDELSEKSQKCPICGDIKPSNKIQKRRRGCNYEKSSLNWLVSCEDCFQEDTDYWIDAHREYISTVTGH